MSNDLERRIVVAPGGKEKTLDEATTIEFPEEISSEEAYRLLEWVSESIHCRIYGNFSGFYNFRPGEETEKYYAEISGTISYFDGQELALATFSLLRSYGEDLGNFSGLKFNTTIDYELHELPPSEVQLFERVREVVLLIFPDIKENKKGIIIDNEQTPVKGVLKISSKKE